MLIDNAILVLASGLIATIFASVSSLKAKAECSTYPNCDDKKGASILVPYTLKPLLLPSYKLSTDATIIQLGGLTSDLWCLTANGLLFSISGSNYKDYSQDKLANLDKYNILGFGGKDIVTSEINDTDPRSIEPRDNFKWRYDAKSMSFINSVGVFLSVNTMSYSLEAPSVAQSVTDKERWVLVPESI
jgi:hypothetical protein